jgi:hypothetical protein
LYDQEPLAQSGTAPPRGGGVTAGSDELVDLAYFIARRPSVELHNSSCAAINGFTSMLALKSGSLWLPRASSP